MDALPDPNSYDQKKKLSSGQIFSSCIYPNDLPLLSGNLANQRILELKHEKLI